MSRIAYVLTAFPTVSETFVEGEFRALMRRGIPIDLYATRNFREITSDADRVGDRGLVVQRSAYLFAGEILRAALYFGFRRPGRTLGALLAIVSGNAGSPRYLAHALALFPKSLVFARRMQRRGTRHVHGTWAHYPATVAYTTSRLLGISYSFTGHAGLDVLSDQSFLGEKVRGARFVLTCHHATRVILEGLAPESAGKIRTIHHGVALAQIPPPGSLPRADPPEIVSVGRLVAWKGFLDLVRAADKLKQRGFTFRMRIFGQGPLRNDLERESRRLGLQGFVFLEGVAPHEQILQALSRASVVALASYLPPSKNMDGIANVLVEAMACGTPVVSTEYDGSRELLEGGRLGPLVPVRDPGRLAEALGALLRDPARQVQLSRLGRERVEKDFDRERNVEAIAALFRETLEAEGEVAGSRSALRDGSELQARREVDLIP